jgi:hypothetical protein
MTITKYDVWFFQIPTILKLSRDRCNRFVGYYSWCITDGQLTENINYINIRPWWGSLILRHEMGHSVVTNRRFPSIDAIAMANVNWDRRSWHGLKFWVRP